MIGWSIKLPACSVRSWSELRLSSGSRAGAEILCRSDYFKLHFAHMRERETQTFIKESKKTTTTKKPEQNQNPTAQTCKAVDIIKNLN